ncbi:MAG: sodium:proton exchanger [Epulopiscium sp. Nele67-Bin005]|nr:MAG: sodium:proton exchanger [Epulopiscium sp. Nele67-Bin005]
MYYVLLLIGFVLLIKGADFFVDGASSIATRLNVSPLLIGLTIVAFGTSAPELAVSITSALSGDNAIAIGNVLGSNIFNFLMVIGVSALIAPFAVDKDILAKEFPFTILAGIILFILGLDVALQDQTMNVISRADGILLLIFFSMFMYYLIASALSNRDNGSDDDEIECMPMSKSILMSIGGALGIVLGGDMVVNNASEIALIWGMSEGLVGLTIVAIGTSLPELVTSVTAAKKGQSDMALGNVIGSSIFNIFLILGVSTAINPIPLNSDIFIDIFFMIAVIVTAYIFALTGKKINRPEGGFFVASYACYMVYILMR